MNQAKQSIKSTWKVIQRVSTAMLRIPIHLAYSHALQKVLEHFLDRTTAGIILVSKIVVNSYTKYDDVILEPTPTQMALAGSMKDLSGDTLSSLALAANVDNFCQSYKCLYFALFLQYL